MEYFNKDDTIRASFNQGQLSQIRLHTLLSDFNLAFSNPLQVNEFGIYNYQTCANILSILLLEITSKLRPEERKELERINKITSDYISDSPIFCQTQGYYSSKPTINVKAWKDIKYLLFYFRTQIELAMEKHGLSNPQAESSTGAMLR